MEQVQRRKKELKSEGRKIHTNVKVGHLSDNGNKHEEIHGILHCAQESQCQDSYLLHQREHGICQPPNSEELFTKAWCL